MKNRQFSICVLFLLLLGCASQKTMVTKDTEERDALESLIGLVEEFKAKNGIFSEQELLDKTAMLDRLCDKDITVSENDSLEDLQHKLERISRLDRIFDKYTAHGIKVLSSILGYPRRYHIFKRIKNTVQLNTNY